MHFIKLNHAGQILLLLILLSGCDPGYEYYQIVKNNTAHEFRLKLQWKVPYDTYNHSKDSVSTQADTFYYYTDKIIKIKPFSCDTIFSDWSLGTMDEIKDCYCEYNRINHFQFVDSVPEVRKDINNVKKNWKRIEVARGSFGGGTVNCVFEINDNDLSE